MRLLGILLISVFCSTLVGALSIGFPFPDGFNVHDLQKRWKELGVRQSKVKLRILPLGASIVFGVGSEPLGNGFRKPLRDQLRFLGYDVDMVGTKHPGTMRDNAEANPGDVINAAATAMEKSLKFKPNVAVINVGTNDCRDKDNGDWKNIGTRMKKLIDRLFDQSPGVTVVLSTLLPSGDESLNRCREDPASSENGSANGQYRKLVSDYQGQGRKIVLADMDARSGPTQGWIKYPDDFFDGLHPHPEGFKKMAYIFYTAILDAESRGFLTAPANVDTGDQAPPGCEKVPGDGTFAGGQTQTGSGDDDGIYSHSSQAMNVIHTVNSAVDQNQFFFARLFSPNRDDLLEWYSLSDQTVQYRVWKNNGNGRFTKTNDLDVRDNCQIAGANFIDVNSDGLDDFVCIGINGDAFASINQGNGNGNNPPAFRNIGTWKSNEGYAQSRVRLADIDGDGRADYCILEENGDIRCWRNGWVDDKPAFWEPMGRRFTGKGMGDLRGVRFRDINGDGRDDWLWVSDTGVTTTWTNFRSCTNGRLGDGLVVDWAQGFASGSSLGPTHAGIGTAGSRNRILFGRVYGEPAYFGGLPRQDYVHMRPTGNAGNYRFEMVVWRNTGNGGAKPKADGVKYCSMRGTKAIDYVWTLSTGKMTMYPSRGVSKIAEGESWWGPSVVIWEPPNGQQIDRRDLHLADWDGDGFCDIVWIDPATNNRPKVWRNKYKDRQRWEWEFIENAAPSNVQCNERRGLGIHDLAVRLADISGNGKVDYLCIQKNGVTRAHFQGFEGRAWTDMGQIKANTDDRDRANLRWADVNGDGRADLIWTDKWSGDGHVYYNDGKSSNPSSSLGSSWLWKGAKKAFDGNAAGTCTYYHDMDGDNRVDQHSLQDVRKNTAITWLNTCGGGENRKGDDGSIVDPQLPRPN